MDYDSPTMVTDEDRDEAAPLYQVVSVQQSTEPVRRRTRRVQTDLILVLGIERVAVRVSDVLEAGVTKRRRRWQVGDSISIPDPKGLKCIVLPPDALSFAPWAVHRHRAKSRVRISL